MDEVYDKLKNRFASNPELATMKEDYQIIKNFGFNKFNDDEEDDEYLEAEQEGLKELGLFDGTSQMERQQYKDKILDTLYGN